MQHVLSYHIVKVLLARVGGAQNGGEGGVGGVAKDISGHSFPYV